MSRVSPSTRTQKAEANTREWATGHPGHRAVVGSRSARARRVGLRGAAVGWQKLAREDAETHKGIVGEV